MVEEDTLKKTDSLIRSYKIKLQPSKTQQKQFKEYFGSDRYCYNYSLAKLKELDELKKLEDMNDKNLFRNMCMGYKSKNYCIKHKEFNSECEICKFKNNLQYDSFEDNLNTKKWLSEYVTVKKEAIYEAWKNYKQFMNVRTFKENSKIKFKNSKHTKNHQFRFEYKFLKLIQKQNKFKNKNIYKLNIFNIKNIKFFYGRKRKQLSLLNQYFQNPKDAMIEKNEFGDYYLILPIYKGDQVTVINSNGKREQMNMDKAKRYKKKMIKENEEVIIERSNQEYIETKECFIDPGIRDFYTLYDKQTHNIFSIGVGSCKKINEMNEKMRMTSKKDLRIKLRRRIFNLKNEFHHKISNWIVTNYDLIYLPKFQKSQMVRNKGRKLKTKTIRQMHTLRHFGVMQLIKEKCKLRQKKVLICNEQSTTQTCGNCYFKNLNIGGAEEYTCPICKKIILRDQNASRNIGILNLIQLF